MRLAVLAMASVLSACGSSNGPGDLDDPDVRAKLRELALQSASNSGVPSPQTMLAVWSPDHQAAEKVVSGSIVVDHVPVYVVEMTGGTFTSLHAPPGVAPPHGDVLTLTIDAQTFEGTDVGIGNAMTDLRKIDAHVVDLLAD
jgi:hypothetical protein